MQLVARVDRVGALQHDEVRVGELVRQPPPAGEVVVFDLAHGYVVRVKSCVSPYAV